jgi:hypothetical protein
MVLPGVIFGYWDHFFVKPSGMGDNSNKIAINESNSINS